jgi:hypothetical protein
MGQLIVVSGNQSVALPDLVMRDRGVEVSRYISSGKGRFCERERERVSRILRLPLSA